MNKKVKCFNCKKKSLRMHVQMIDNKSLLCSKCIKLAFYALVKGKYFPKE